MVLLLILRGLLEVLGLWRWVPYISDVTIASRSRIDLIPYLPDISLICKNPTLCAVVYATNARVFRPLRSHFSEQAFCPGVWPHTPL